MGIFCTCVDSTLGLSEAVEAIEAAQKQPLTTKEGFPVPRTMHSLVFAGPMPTRESYDGNSKAELEHTNDTREAPQGHGRESARSATPPGIEGVATPPSRQSSAGDGPTCAPGAQACFSPAKGSRHKAQKMPAAKVAGDGQAQFRRMPSGAFSELSVATATPSVISSISTQPSIVSMTKGSIDDSYRFEEPAAQPGQATTSVQLATRVADDLPVVIKGRSKAVAFNGEVSAELQWLQEMKAQLEMPKSSAVCELVEVIQTSTHCYVVIKRAAGRDLRSWLAGGEAVSRALERAATARDVVRQMLRGLADMHAAQRTHGNLSPESVMVHIEPCRKPGAGSQVTTTLIGFDAPATWTDHASKETRIVGSPGYVAPEAYQGRLTPASDVYSAGVIMYQLLTRKLPVPLEAFDVKLGEGSVVGSELAGRIHKSLQEVKIDFSPLSEGSCPAAAALCRSLLAFRPEERPSAEEALAHEWFAPGDAALQA